MIYSRAWRTIKSFFASKISRQVKELYVATSIINLAVAMVAVFEPIYLYNIGFSLEGILFFYLAVYVLYLMVMPLGAKFARRFGYEKAILVSSPFLAFFYIGLFLIPTHHEFVVVSILALVVQKMFYWPGYHADFARFGKEKERGREVSNIIVVSTIVAVAGPLIGGVLISVLGFNALFIVVVVLILLSNIPLLTTPERFTPQPFSYINAYRRLIRRDNRKNFLGFIGFGEEFVAMIIWPIFIFLVLGDFISIGSLVALSALATSLMLLYVGKLTDGDVAHRHSVLKIGSVFKSVVWLLRLLVTGGLGIFLTDTLARITKNVLVIPMMAMTYDHASETSVMKTVIFFEMALVVGKIFVMLASLGILAFFPGSFSALFILAAGMTLLYTLVRYEPIRVGKQSMISTGT